MNIYIHLENILRELDSKLLLATIAASKGHEVIISDIESIDKGIRRGVLAPEYFILNLLHQVFIKFLDTKK